MLATRSQARRGDATFLRYLSAAQQVHHTRGVEIDGAIGDLWLL